MYGCIAMKLALSLTSSSHSVIGWLCKNADRNIIDEHQPTQYVHVPWFLDLSNEQ